MTSQRAMVAASLLADEQREHHHDAPARCTLAPARLRLASDSRSEAARVHASGGELPGQNGCPPAPSRCQHGTHPDVVCGECVLASWESAPRGPAPRRLRAEIQRDEQLERLAEDRAERREWRLGDEPVPRVIPGSRRVA